MASNRISTLSALLNSSTIIDHEEVLKVVNGVLKISKNSQDALHTRVVALLKLDRFDDVLQALDDGGHDLAHRCMFEKAYALYKVGRLEEAAKIVEDAGVSGPRGLRHVAAQLAYRAEKFGDAGRIYKELSVTYIEGEEGDLMVNSSAVDVQLEWQDSGDKVEPTRKKPGKEDLEAFEMAYNIACGYIARGDLGTGSALLKRARDLCEALDELTDEEKKAEVLPIIVQQAYVLIRTGKQDEASTLLKTINIADVLDAPTGAVAWNNAIAAMVHDDNPYLTQRLFNSVPVLSTNERLFEYQANILRRNRYTIDLQAHKYVGVAKSSANILSKAPSPTISSFFNNVSTMNAASYTHCQSSHSSLEQALLLQERRPTDVGLILTIIQVHIQANNSGAAISLLETFFKRIEESTAPADQYVRFAPGLVALLISLYRLEGRKGPIKAELKKAASYWRARLKPPEDLLMAAGISLLNSSRLEELAAAGEIFSSLRNLNPTNRVAITGFIASNASTNSSAIEPDLDRLSTVDHLISGIDAAALERGGIACIPFAVTNVSRKRTIPVEKDKPQNKRIRKSKMPKEFEEGRKMDLERWLPMRDRSSYRPKGKKGKKALDTTQGGIAKEEESLELVGGVGAVKVERASAGGGGKAKKKKAKK